MNLFLLSTLFTFFVFVSAQEGYVVRFHSSKIAKDNRRGWIDNQLRKASLPPLTDSEAASLKIGWETSVYDGFAGKISAEAAAAFKATEDVWYIEQDVPAKLTTSITQNDAPWGLQRISQRAAMQSSDPTQTNFVYTYDDSAGQGVDIYIIDTGVRTTHTEFGGRATFGKSFGDGVPGQDIQGHGTHVAGIAASALHGVAKSANIIAVKVMGDDGTGSGSDIISGINFVVQAVAQSSRPSVINMSITTPGSQAIDEAAANAVSFGIHVVVAAGNESKDAGDDSPARSSAVIAVGATDISDRKASFSNFGPDVNIWAPGVGIISLGTASDTAVKTLDGTSMASPFVTGLVAYFLALEGTVSPLSMKQKLRSLTTSGIISNLPSNTTNVLAFNDASTVATPDPAFALQQSILGSIDNLVSAFNALGAQAL